MSVGRSCKTDVRGGAVLAMVLASLLVAVLVGFALIKTVLVHHRQMHRTGQQQQCFRLAEAAVQRAVRRLAGASDYQGETWEISAQVLGAAQPAVVTIEVTKTAGAPAARRIRVDARYPDDPLRRSVCRQELVFLVPPDSRAERGDAEGRPMDGSGDLSTSGENTGGQATSATNLSADHATINGQPNRGGSS